MKLLQLGGLHSLSGRLKIRYKPFDIDVRTGRGTAAVTWEPVAGPHKGFIQPLSGGEVFRDGKGGESATHRLYTSVNTPTKYGYRITQNGQEYIMLYAVQPSGISGVVHHKELILGIFE